MSADAQALLAKKLPKNFTRAYFQSVDTVVFLNKKTQVGVLSDLSSCYGDGGVGVGVPRSMVIVGLMAGLMAGLIVGGCAL
jgi:hypothetical protein